MRFFILTDLEGVAGVDSFTQTRTVDDAPKAFAMQQLAQEVNACIQGIRSIYADAHIDVWDGHGPGGLHEKDVQGGNYLKDRSGARAHAPYFDLSNYDALLFVGQHAMAGTPFAPLRHTYSSLHVEYYKLNGVFVGEFGCRAALAGVQGVPTIFLSGDDKAALEAQVLIPNIVTAVVKRGKGLEAAEHLSSAEACALVFEQTVRAVQALPDILPLTGFKAPYELEIKYVKPGHQQKWSAEDVSWIDERTVLLKSEDLKQLPI